MTITEINKRLKILESERKLNNSNVSISIILNTEDAKPNEYLINGIPATKNETKQIEEEFKKIKPIPNTFIKVVLTDD